MSFPNIKIAVGQQDRTAIKGRVVARFPAQVWGANGLRVTKASGSYTLANDWGALVSAASVADGARTWLPVWLEGDEYRRIAFDAFVAAMVQGQLASFSATIDGGGIVISTGISGDISVPFACEILEVTALADQTGSIVVDVWRDSYANFPPVDADSITGSSPITISSALKSTDATLTGWSKTLSAGDVLRFNVDSVTSIKRVTISFKVRRA